MFYIPTGGTPCYESTVAVGLSQPPDLLFHQQKKCALTLHHFSFIQTLSSDTCHYVGLYFLVSLREYIYNVLTAICIIYEVFSLFSVQTHCLHISQFQ